MIEKAWGSINTFRYNPHNCTVCKQFRGNLVFRSDFDVGIKDFEEVVWFDCEHFGCRYCNNGLEICAYFDFDEDRDIIVYRDDTYPFNFRLFRRVKKAEENGLEGIIYDLVHRVAEIDSRGYLLKVCVKRINKQLGISEETIFREVMRMVEAGLLSRAGPFLLPLSNILKIDEVKGLGDSKRNE